MHIDRNGVRFARSNADEDGTLSSSMMTKAKNTLVKERLGTSRMASEIVFQFLHPETGAPLQGV